MEDTIVSELRIPEEENEELDDEEEDDDIDDEEELDDDDDDQNLIGKRSGRGLTLKTLLKEKVLEPGDANMTINYLGNKFKGDLLPDGRIRSQETSKIFGTPSAWAIYCKKIVNPEKKSGCGWASVRYRGKKLDAYKNNWFRQKRIEYEKEEEEIDDDDSCSDVDDGDHQEQLIVEFDNLGNKCPEHDSSTMVELSTFQSLGRMQPFNITMSSSAMAVIDVHSHFTTSEVIGYLAGQWDVNNHNLIVSHAFPVRCHMQDLYKGAVVEQELFSEMAQLKLSLVGWYHTHPFTPPLPSLRDIDSQLDYEIKMKGYNDASYTPVLGIIAAPYQKTPLEKGVPHSNGNAAGFWVMPPPENKPLEYGRPMSMQFTIVQDAFIPKEALMHIKEVVAYYKDSADAIVLSSSFDDKLTYWHKLKYSLRGRVPKDHLSPLLEFLTKLIDEKLPEDDPIPLPPPSPEPTAIEEKVPEILKDSSLLLPDFSDSRDRSSPKADEQKTDVKTPLKSYSPLFQLPLPPLFPIDSVKSPIGKDSTKSTQQASTSEKKPEISDQIYEGGSKSEVLFELASKLCKNEASSSSRFLDLSMIGKDTEKIKKDDKDSTGVTWLAQAKLMQEALENPFSREVPQIFPPEFLTAQWNPTAAAAALHLARESYNPDVASLFSQKPDTSKPTYHSDVPLILKKQETASSEDSKKKIEFRVPREVKDLKDIRSPRKRDLETRDAESKDMKATRDPRSPMPHFKDSSEVKETVREAHLESVVQLLPSSLEKRLCQKPEVSITPTVIPLEATKSFINLRDPPELMRSPPPIMPDEVSSSLNELRKLIDSNSFESIAENESRSSAHHVDDTRPSSVPRLSDPLSTQGLLVDVRNSESLRDLQASARRGLQVSPKRELQSSTIRELRASAIREFQASALRDLQSSSIGDLRNTSIRDLSSSSIRDLSSSSIRDLSTASIRDLSTASIRDLQSPSIRDLSSPSIRDLSSSSIRDLSSASIRDLSTASIRDLSTASIRDLSTASIRDLSSPSIRDLQSPSIRDLQSPSIRDLQSPSIRDLQSPSIRDLQQSQSVRDLPSSSIRDIPVPSSMRDLQASFSLSRNAELPISLVTNQRLQDGSKSDENETAEMPTSQNLLDPLFKERDEPMDYS